MAAKKVAPSGPKFTVTRIPLDSGGYSKGKFGKYYGRGLPLFHVEADLENLDELLEAAGVSAGLLKTTRTADLPHALGGELGRQVRAILQFADHDIRAVDRDDVKARIRDKIPDARF